jgi:cell division protein FtsW
MKNSVLRSLFPSKQKPVDYPLLFSVGTLIIFGLFAFFSAALADVGKTSFMRIIVTQLIAGLGVGGLMLWTFSRLRYQALAQWAPWIFIIGWILCFTVFIPGLGMAHGGGTRWLDLHFITFQPGEILKFGAVTLYAWWCAKYKKKLSNPKYGLLVLLGGIAFAGIVMGLQRDYGSFTIIVSASIAIYLASAAPLRHIVPILLVGALAAGAIATFVPHVNQRVMTLIKCDDLQGSCWQVRQGLIALGSGGMWGEGYLQSTQRFGYLPEAHGDSIFAVIGEEFGFVGAAFVVFLYAMFSLRAFYVAARAQDEFGALLIVGFAVMILTQSFLNMGSVLGVIPFTGEPLVFMSQGGTSLVIAMAAIGVMLNISRTKFANPLE